MRRLFPLLLLAFFFTAATSGAEPLTIDSDTQLAYARSLESSGDYNQAAMEYSRFIHFFPDSKSWRAAHYARALALYQAGDFKKAGAAFALYRNRFEGTPLHLAAGMMEAKCRNRLGDPASGILILSNLKGEAAGDAEAEKQLRLRMAWTRLEMGDLPRAEAAFEASAESVESLCGVPGILGTMERFKALPEKSSLTAGSFAVIPGAGYLYLGRYQDAAVTFLLNVAMGLAAAESFDDGNNALGGIISFVGFGFYSGSIHGSYTGARKVNRLSRESLWKEMLLWGAELEKRGNDTCLGLTLTVPFP